MTIVSKLRYNIMETLMKLIVLLPVFAMLLSPSVSIAAKQDKSLGEYSGNIAPLMEAIKSGIIAYKLTDPNEIKAILGEPQTEKTRRDGEMVLLEMYFPNNVRVRFSKFTKYGEHPFTLRGITINGIGIDLDDEGPLVLRTTKDLKKINLFDGLQTVSLKFLDLTKHYDHFKNFNFDTLTQWPGPEKLPSGFDPRKLMEEGKNPGLGIRSLHEQGINGDGIGIAIFDQPLLFGHEEYTSRLVRYDATKSASRLVPRMHGSPVVSIAVGKKCGVAPGAFVFYYAAGTTEKPRIQADWINEIIKYNETTEDSPRIRVISISASPEEASNNDAFLKAHKKALEAGILVVTCSRKFLDYGSLNLIEGKNPDDP